MVMTYEQWQLILGVIDEEINLSADNVMRKIRELLNRATIIEPREISGMLEGISSELSNIPRVQETQEPLTKRLKVVNVPEGLGEAKKILDESRVSNAQQMVKIILKRLGVRETSEESKSVHTINKKFVSNIRKCIENNGGYINNM